MKKALRAILAVVLGLASPAFADFIPLPIKWSQPIGFDGPTSLPGPSSTSPP